MFRFRRHLSILTRAAAVLLLFAAFRPAAAEMGAENACGVAIAQHETRQSIPPQLLAAIALAESGRWDKTRRASFAWPWTVTSGPDTRYLASKGEAMAYVESLRGRGVRNIDVGCMQINLQHHARAFRTLEEAFDPFVNVAYGAQFLRELRDETRSWSEAVSRYHSSNRALNLPYRERVYRLWNDARRDAYLIRREAMRANYGRPQAANG